MGMIMCVKEPLQDDSEVNKIGNRFLFRTDSMSDAGCFHPDTSCWNQHLDSMLVGFPFYLSDSLLFCDSVFANFSVDIYICDDSTIYFSNFEIHSFWGCDSLQNMINNLYASGNYNEISRIHEMIEFQASMYFEQKYLENKYYSGGGNWPHYYIESHFYRILCYQTCLINDNSKKTKYPVLRYTKVACGSKCCERVRRYHVVNKKLISSEPYYIEIGDGHCENIPMEPCNGILSGNCERVCGKP